MAPLGDVYSRVGAFIGFLMVAVPGAFWLHTSGRLNLTPRR
jgi:hypothetical protein